MAKAKKYRPTLRNGNGVSGLPSNEVASARIQAPPHIASATNPLVHSLPSREGGNSRDMKRHNEKKKQDSHQNSRRSRHFWNDGSDCGCDERDAYKVRPKQPPRHPCRHQPRNEIGIQEMLNSENYQGNGDENPSG